MPWQAVPSFLIIGGAFNVAAGIIWGVQRLGYGEVRSRVEIGKSTLFQEK